jgi:hypothetical protein
VLRFTSTVTERTGAEGVTERVTKVKTGTLPDSKSELPKLPSGQTAKSQKVSIASLHRGKQRNNGLSFTETVIGAAVRTARKK